jgi:hypothetical protein
VQQATAKVPGKLPGEMVDAKPVASVIRPVVYQPPSLPMDPRTSEELAREYQIQLEPPSAERVFRIESEQALRERIRQEYRQRNDKADFPRDIHPAAKGERHAGRNWGPQAIAMVAPNICYKPLYFEDVNTERYGWSVCIFQPAISAAKFYADLAFLPYHMTIDPPCSCEYPYGYALPGDRVPFYCYKPKIDGCATWVEAAVVVGLVFAVP